MCLGYSQIPGVDFSDNYAPVGNDVTFRIVMVLRLMFGFHAVLLDVETAFLYGKLEEEIYMEIPSGYKEVYQEAEKGTVLKLQMAMYGLVQAARQWFKCLSDVLISLGFKPCESDPCLMYRVNENGLCIILMYVDDNLIVGSNKAIAQVTEEIKNVFSVTVSPEATEYLGCEIHVAKNHTCGWIGQPHLYKNLEQKFGNIVKTQRMTETPSTPGFHVVRNIPNAVYITDEKQKLYRSGVGMLLYLVKHSRPDLSNGTRELSKVMDKATEGHMKELCRMIKYALDTRHIGLKLKPEENDNKLWELKAYSDADFAVDKETRISVTGYVVYFMSVPVCWRSRGQKSVTLSTTEAEYVACSEVVKEVLFILQLLKHLQVELQLPIRVHVDNIGAIFLAENQNSSDRTKHVDTRYHFVRQYIKDGTVLIEFVRSHDNDSDIFTKNTTSEVHHRHSEKLTWTKEEYESEASRITTGRVLRGIVNHSYGKLQRNSDWNESLINSDWNESLINSEWNESLIEHKRLRDTNRYEVLEKYDEVENEVEIGTKVQFE